MKVWKIAAVGVGALFAVGVLGSAVGGGSHAPAAPSDVAAASVKVEKATSAPVKIVASTEFGTGVYDVGTGDGEIPPGKYKSTGPEDQGGMCYYALLRSSNSTDITSNNLTQGPNIMTVRASTKVVEITGCSFRKV